jgi:uncharacterized protein YjbJ (UPF0337 family)
MNRYQVEAFTQFVIGRIQEDAGKMVRNKNLENSGYRKQIGARARKAIGEADCLIKRCNALKGQSKRFASH